MCKAYRTELDRSFTIDNFVRTPHIYIVFSECFVNKQCIEQSCVSRSRCGSFGVNRKVAIRYWLHYLLVSNQIYQRPPCSHREISFGIIEIDLVAYVR